MASVFKPVYVKRGRDGRRIRKHSKVWWIEYSNPHLGRRVRAKGYADELATRILASDLERKAQRAAVGAVDPFEESRRLSLAKHLEAYEAHLKVLGVVPMHLGNTRRALRAVFKAARVGRIDALTSAQIEHFLVALQEKGRSSRTRNVYLATLRAFFRWAIRVGRIDTNPTVTVPMAAAQEDVRRERRALSPEEVSRLLEAARVRPLEEVKAPRKRRHTPGPGELERCRLVGLERALIYKVAVLTGLRRGELRQLLWGDLTLDGDRPMIRVRASVSKNGKTDWLPLRQDLVRDLLAWRGMHPGAKDSDRVLQVPQHIVQHLRDDLKLAGIPYRDEQNRVVDFHSLRHTAATMMARSGVSPRVAQALLRHAHIETTMAAYTHLEGYDKAAAADSLPTFPALGGDPEVAGDKREVG